MKIYRVEHIENTAGPFFQADSTLCKQFQCIVSTHPAPKQDGIENFDDEDDRLGCVSLEQLKFWFQNYIPYLKKLQMVVRIFDCADEFVKHGRNQVAFHYANAKLTEELTLDCLE